MIFSSQNFTLWPKTHSKFCGKSDGWFVDYTTSLKMNWYDQTWGRDECTELVNGQSAGDGPSIKCVTEHKKLGGMSDIYLRLTWKVLGGQSIAFHWFMGCYFWNYIVL